MHINPGFLQKISLCLLILLAWNVIFCSAEPVINIPEVNTSDLYENMSSYQGNETMIFPPPPVNISDIKNTIATTKNKNHTESVHPFADTGMATMGNVVLVPVTPTPEGWGYSYFNTTGSDQSYYIYSPGTYTLQSGFYTRNDSAIHIGASDVVLEGNAQTISGYARNQGVSTESGLTNITISNFAGINVFDVGISSNSDRVSLINDSISDSNYMGVYSIGSDFQMDQCVLRNSNELGIFLYGTNAVLTRNKLFDSLDYAIYSYSNNISILQNSFINNAYSLYSDSENMVFNQNTVTNSTYAGAVIRGDRITCSENVLTQNPNHLYIAGSNSTINNNTLSSAKSSIVTSRGENITISDNIISKSEYGIRSITNDCKIINNKIYSSKQYGIRIQGDNGTISENTIRDTMNYGVSCSGNNSTIKNNIVTNASYGVEIYDNDNSTIIGNTINNSAKSALLISDELVGKGEGLIFNNYFGSDTNIQGYGNFNNYSYSWTNPSGPIRGTNVVGGPFIAGNYWSNATGTGWSDQQTPNVTGYSTKPYTTQSGINDSAPLVPQKPVTINATANEWSNIVPAGNTSYRSYTNQTFITQPKPGADMPDVIVDSASKGNVTSWTFADLSDNHDIQAIGNPTPGQVHVFFTTSQRYGESPLTVSFSSEQSLGSPTSWYWQFGDGIANTTQNPVHTYETPGMYTVSLRALNSQTGGYAVWNNCITVTDGVVPQPTQIPVPGKITPQFSAYPATGNAPLTVDFRDKSTGNPVTWEWDFGDGTYSSLQNPSHVYSTPGSYPVTLSVKNENYAGSLRIPGAVTVS